MQPYHQAAEIIMNNRETTTLPSVADSLFGPALAGPRCQLVQHDPRAPGPEPVYFDCLLTVAIALARRNQKVLALLFIGLDRFREIKEAFGHAASEELLCQAAGRMRASLRESDMLIRQDEDGFMVMLQNINDDREAELVALKLIEQLDRPFDIGGLAMNVRGTVGIALFPGDTIDLDVLIRTADWAMLQARQMTGPALVFFDPAMQRDFMARQTLNSDLRRALENDELVLHYQPVVRLPRHRFVGVEALIRWNHPQHGLIGPEVFLPAAEDSGLIKPIGRWVIAQACRQMGAWCRQGQSIPVSVNISSRQLAEDIPLDWLCETMARCAVHPKTLTFEFNKRWLSSSAAPMDQWLSALTRMQVSSALDGFDNGHASLARLRDLGIDHVKIGSSLIKALRSDEQARARVKSVVETGREMQLRVTAKGVEDADTLAILGSLGCGQVQGFHLGHPMPPDEVADFVAKPAPAAHRYRRSIHFDSATALAFV